MLTFTGPLNFSLTLRRYHVYGEDAANAFDGRVFRKVFDTPGGLHLASIKAVDDRPSVSIFPASRRPAVKQEAERIARKILGLDFNLPAFYQMAGADPVLKLLIKKFHGLRPTLSPGLFEVLVTSITAQQINLQFAFTVRSRLVRKYGTPLHCNGQTYFAFPTPEALARARVSSLRKLQFTQRKAEYIVSLAREIADDELALEDLQHRSEAEICERLTALRGIGRWTVDWFLARGLGRGSAFPAGDLGVAKAVRHFYFKDQPQDEDTLRAFAARWGDFQNLAVHYLLFGYYVDER